MTKFLGNTPCLAHFGAQSDDNHHFLVAMSDGNCSFASSIGVWYQTLNPFGTWFFFNCQNVLSPVQVWSFLSFSVRMRDCVSKDIFSFVPSIFPLLLILKIK